MYQEPRFAPLMEYTRQLVDLTLLKSDQDIKESYVSLLERKHFWSKQKHRECGSNYLDKGRGEGRGEGRGAEKG